MSGARIHYVAYLHELQRKRDYEGWSEKNKVLLYLERLFIYAFMISLVGFLAAGMLNSLVISRFLFVCFIIFLLSGIVSSLMLFRKVPRDWNKE